MTKKFRGHFLPHPVDLQWSCERVFGLVTRATNSTIDYRRFSACVLLLHAQLFVVPVSITRVSYTASKY